MKIEISPGEFLDRLTILELKLERITDADKLKNVRYEYSLLSAAARLPLDESTVALRDSLKIVNGELWRIEDEIRERERDEDFGESFIKLARSVYLANDRRAAIKRKINLRLNSQIIEEKQYAGRTAEPAHG